MKLDTPLAQVAELLEPRSAELLQYRSFETQELVLGGVRLFLAMLEEYGFVLDPIDRGDRIHRMVCLWVDYL